MTSGIMTLTLALAACKDPSGGPGPGHDPDDPAPYVPPACVAGEGFSTGHGVPRMCGRPVAIGSGFGGNGHTESWDGRVFIVTKNTNVAPHTVGWVVRILRPERLKLTNGALDFSAQAFSDELVLETDANGHSHNAIAVIAAPGLDENPYPSDVSGNAQPGGTYQTYEMILYAQNYEESSILQQRRLRVVVKDPLTMGASVQSATFLDEFQIVKTKGDHTIHAIEPTLTADGRLLIAQGHPINDGRIDYLIYSYNETPGAVTGWSEPRFITDMYAVDRDTMVDGVRFADRFPIAMEPLRDQRGVAFTAAEPFHGAYPWISHDGTELFYMATVAGDNTARPGERARRGGASVIGRFTNWGLRHIDGPINPSRDGMTPSSTVRLFFSSPGAMGTMWSPYLEKSRPLMPYTAGHPIYPLFGSNTGNYVEVAFEDTLDREYVLALRMNELVGHDSNIDPTRTPDTSGNYNTGVLEGAKFPIEQNAVDQIVGNVGQALYFPEAGAVRVADAPSFERLTSAITVELFVKRAVNMDQDAENRPRYLLRKAGAFDLILEESGVLQATVRVAGAELRSGAFGPALPLNEWVHVAFTYEAATGTLRGFRDGAPAISVTGTPGPIDTSASDLIIGPDSDTASPFVAAGTPIMLLDELLVSAVVRSDEEIARSAFHCETTTTATIGALPLGLRAEDLQVPADAVSTDAVRALGRALFFDPLLSGENDTSCATCHLPDAVLTDGRPTALGRGPKFLSRNTPSLFNRAFGSAQFWDGREGSLEAQALIPIANPDEMNLPLTDAVARLAASPAYVTRFQAAFSAGPSAERIAQALAAFERSLLSGNSRVDRYENGEASALTESEMRGRAIFRGPRGRCVGCHGGSNYTDELFHNNGSVCVGDVGRGDVTGRARDFGAFKTPSLRDVALTAPYMHDGSLASLEDVIEAYDVGGLHANGRDAEIRPLGLSTAERRDLLAFLRALNGSDVTVSAP